MARRKSRIISIGGVKIGGKTPVSVQSMTKTDTRDIKRTVQQIKGLERIGCEIVRVAVPDMEAAEKLGKIREKIDIPLIADIHFDHRLALKAIDKGVDALRLNPGNIGGRNKVREVVKAAKEKRIPIRIGVNAGSLEKELLKKYPRNLPKAMVISALKHVMMLEELDFPLIKISLKASDVVTTIDAYRMIAKKVDYPLHLGITEAGTVFSGTIKSSLGIGILLSEGIGDTIRVSLTGDPREEVRVGFSILNGLGLRKRGIEIISCPTCGRCEIDLLPIANRIERELSYISMPLKVAIMGCSVNGPGEARHADIGLAGGKGRGVLFRKGKIIGRVKEKEMEKILKKEIEEFVSKH
jgi:(E)-4-hydroxy-3-methylbut-2-enyl-diphosphate synthase